MITRSGKSLKNEPMQEERCTVWLKSFDTNELIPEDLRENDSEGTTDDFINSDDEFDSVSECGDKKRRKIVVNKKTDIILDLVCKWLDCKFQTKSIEHYVNHISNHVTELKVRIETDESQVYVCQWSNCNYANSDSAKITKHVNYHSYHSKLMCIGSNIRAKVKLPKCLREPMSENLFDLDTQLICEWDECLKMFNNFQQYLFHITQHVHSNPRGNNVKGGIECRWNTCKKSYPSIHKLKDHMKTHSKEKAIACPTCGAAFASNTKFYNHCRRQIPLEAQGFQCSYCTKFYPTEGILKEHMRLHIFHYKCTLCDMSCESQASLVRHVRYRHIDARPFPCQLCSHSAKSQQDLDYHMSVHTDGHNFICDYDGCSYTCKNAYILDRHIERVHMCEIRWYCCHECPIKYQSSSSLTRHLLETHKFQLPQGYKRFQYISDNDGYYRLQTVRYEYIEEDDNDAILGNVDKNYKVKINSNFDSDVPKFQVVEERDDENDNTLEVEADFEFDVINNGKSMPIISNILISMDTDGNLIESKVIETQETSEGTDLICIS